MILQLTEPVKIILDGSYGPYIDEFANSFLVELIDIERSAAKEKR